MTFLDGPRRHLRLHMCNDIPHGQSPYPCTTIFDSTVPLPHHDVRFLQGWEAGFSVIPQENLVIIKTPSNSISLSDHCIQTLLFPSQMSVPPHHHPILATHPFKTASGTSGAKISPGSASNSGCSPSPSLPSSTSRSHTCRSTVPSCAYPTDFSQPGRPHDAYDIRRMGNVCNLARSLLQGKLSRNPRRPHHTLCPRSLY